jgi:spore maturation protein CgeB
MGQPNTLDEKRQLRLRDFEIPICGGFYLTQNCKQLNELFIPGEHLETWNDFSELLDKISYYLKHPQERNAIAQSGIKHCLKYHTWENRFKGLLKELNIV